MWLISVVVVMCLVCGPAGAEWRVDKLDRLIAWADAAEPAGNVTARLQVECLQDSMVGGRIASVVLSEEMTAGRIGVTFRFDQGALEHRIVPMETNLQTVPLLKVSADRIARGKRFRIALHPAGREPLFFEFDLTGSAAAIAAVSCRR